VDRAQVVKVQRHRQRVRVELDHPGLHPVVLGGPQLHRGLLVEQVPQRQAVRRIEVALPPLALVALDVDVPRLIGARDALLGALPVDGIRAGPDLPQLGLVDDDPDRCAARARAAPGEQLHLVAASPRLDDDPAR
jgi:hypothetical protein